VSFPAWEGNCPGGHADVIWAANGDIWSVNADRGDDLIYGKFYLYQSNVLSYTLYCKRSWWQPGYYQPGYQVTLRPTRSNQTFWVGPWGQTHN
jgi:hypothetical protein